MFEKTEELLMVMLQAISAFAAVYAKDEPFDIFQNIDSSMAALILSSGIRS